MTEIRPLKPIDVVTLKAMDVSEKAIDTFVDQMVELATGLLEEQRVKVTN